MLFFILFHSVLLFFNFCVFSDYFSIHFYFIFRSDIGSMMDNKEQKKEKNKIKTISDLDDDSLLIIFSLLNIRDRTRCERVCQRWNNLIIHSWASAKSLVFKEAFCLWKDTEILDMDTFHKILKKCPNLQSIDLEQASADLNEKTCEIIGQCCPDLEKLILRDTDLSKYSVTIIGKACPKLKSIDFTKCGNISERSLWELFNSRPDMEYISLSQVENITGKCFYLLKALSHLDLSGSRSICTEAFSKLGQNCSQSLKTLLAPPINNEGLKIICMTFPNLEFLQVEMSNEAVDGYQVALSGARLLGNLTKLQVLRFFPELEDLDNSALLSIMKKCPDLRDLRLFGTDKLTDLSVANLPKYCKNLRKLNLEGSKISDDSVRALAHLKKLAVLKIAGSLITDEGAMYILTHSTSLELLSINQCLGINVKTILYAWDLVKQGLVSKDLVIKYKDRSIKVNELATRDFETELDWASYGEYRSSGSVYAIGDEERQEMEERQEREAYDIYAIGDEEREAYDMNAIGDEERQEMEERQEREAYDIYAIGDEEREAYDIYAIGDEEREAYDIYAISDEEREAYDIYAIGDEDREEMEEREAYDIYAFRYEEME